jgi:hypothetical protein
MKNWSEALHYALIYKTKLIKFFIHKVEKEANLCYDKCMHQKIEDTTGKHINYKTYQ